LKLASGSDPVNFSIKRRKKVLYQMVSQRVGISLLSALIFVLLLPGFAQARIYLDITSAELRQVPMAVPGFVNKSQPGQSNEPGRRMADLMSRALAFHGFIAIIPPDRYGGRQDANWQSLAAEFTVLGQYETDASGMVIELRLNDVKEGRMILGRRYRGPVQDQGTMIRRFADEIIHQLTGLQGISNSRISFVSDASGFKEIWIADVLGEEIRQITEHRNLAVSPRFSPDGRRLAYTTYHRDNPDLYLTDLGQSRTTRPISRRPGLNMAPSWSPDGRTLAVTISNDDNPDLYLMNPQGEIIERLTRNAGLNVSPSWSPDGRQLAFVSDRSGQPQIYIMDVKTKGVRRLTYQGNYNSAPSWSPMGDLIAYTGRHEGNFHLFLISPQGGAPIRITSSWGDHEGPSWSPDGRQLVFTRTRNGEEQLCTIFRNGSGLRVLFPVRGNQSFPQWSPRLES
jgi:TolB protein